MSLDALRSGQAGLCVAPLRLGFRLGFDFSAGERVQGLLVYSYDYRALCVRGSGE
jgi:hypothetical protein